MLYRSGLSCGGTAPGLRGELEYGRAPRRIAGPGRLPRRLHRLRLRPPAARRGRRDARFRQYLPPPGHPSCRGQCRRPGLPASWLDLRARWAADRRAGHRRARLHAGRLRPDRSAHRALAGLSIHRDRTPGGRAGDRLPRPDRTARLPPPGPDGLRPPGRASDRPRLEARGREWARSVRLMAR